MTDKKLSQLPVGTAITSADLFYSAQSLGGGSYTQVQQPASALATFCGGGGGNVSNSGTPTVNQYARWVTATTIEGVAPATVLSDIGAQPAGSYQPLDATLTAWAAYNTNGLLTQTAADTFTGRTLTAPAAGITITNGNGVAGNPTLVLANDLGALEALGGTNTIYYRSGTDTWTAVTIGTGLTFSGGNLAVVAGGVPRTQRLITASGAVTPNAITDQIITFNVTAGTAPSYALPTSTARNAVASGAPITFKDIGGGFATRNLTITPSDNIEGSASPWVLENNYAGITLWPRTDGGAGWFVL